MISGTKIEVMLASKTPIYAPLYWGRAIGIGNLSDFTFTYPDKMASIGIENGKFTSDPLIAHLLRKNSKSKHKPKIVVCDPCRSIFCTKADYDDLVLKKSFLRHLTFDLVDKHNKDKPTHIISHPHGMTGHMLATCYFYEEGNGAISREEMDKKILPLKPSILEQEVYDELSEKTKGHRDIQTGYMSSDIKIKLGLRGTYKKLPLTDEKFDVSDVMTAFITTSQNSEMTEVAEFFKSISSVLMELRQGAARRAAFDLLHDNETKAIFRDHSLESLTLMLETMSGSKVGLVSDTSNDISNNHNRPSYFCDPLIFRDKSKRSDYFSGWRDSCHDDLRNTKRRLEIYKNVYEDLFIDDHLENYKRFQTI